MFTKRHYEAIADIIWASKSVQHKKENCCNGPLLCKNYLIEKLIAFFKEDNPKFDEKKFRKYLKEQHD